MNPPRLVGLRVAVKVIHAFGGTRDAEDYVSIGEQRNARRNGIRSQWRVGSLEGAVTYGTKVHGFGCARAEIFHLLDAWRKEVVIQDRLKRGESLQTHQFFTI